MSIRIMSKVFDSDLPTTERFVLLAMADYASDSGESIFPSVETLARKTGLADRTVQMAIQSLIETGYLELVKKGGGRNNTNRYRIICSRFTDSAKDESGAEKGERGAEKGERHSPEPSVTVKNRQLIVDLAEALAEVTGMSMIVNHKQIFAEAKVISADARVSPELIRIVYAPGGIWYTQDWRGKLGQRPKLYDIRATLFTFGTPEETNVIRGGLKSRPVTERGGVK